MEANSCLQENMINDAAAYSTSTLSIVVLQAKITTNIKLCSIMTLIVYGVVL